MSVSELNIYQRINKVMQVVQYVQKDAQVQGYKAVTHDQVVSAARKALVEAGIVLSVSQLEGKYDDPVNGSKMRLYIGKYEISFTNMDKPEEKVSQVIEAHALDNSDKAPGKCCTYATKTAVLKLLWLETGDNDESREEIREKSKTLDHDQFNQIAEYCISGNDLTPIGKKMCQAYRIQRIDLLPSVKFEEAIARCKKAQEAAQ